jgi:hypothetical protein
VDAKRNLVVSLGEVVRGHDVDVLVVLPGVRKVGVDPDVLVNVLNQGDVPVKSQ